MMLPDVNVLIYAFRSDMHQHAICRHWLERVVEDQAPFGISHQVLAAVVRITTNPRAFRIPSPIEEAFAFCDNLLGQPHCQVIDPGGRHFEIFRELCVRTETRGARVTDAWFAALAIESGCEWITFDRDYARFPRLTWRVPSVA